MVGFVSDIACLRKFGLQQGLNGGDSSFGLFSNEQYILGDSSYVNQPHMMAYIKRFDINEDKSNFNTYVAKAIITNKHQIGVLKSWWHSLEEIWTQINDKASNHCMVNWIGVCVNQLHNDLWTDQVQAIILDVDYEVQKDMSVLGPQIHQSILV